MNFSGEQLRKILTKIVLLSTFLLLLLHGFSFFSDYSTQQMALAREKKVTLESIEQEERIVNMSSASLFTETSSTISEETNQEFPDDEYYKEQQKTAYLTFDDGPSEITPLVLDILKHYQIPATFFVIGKQVENHIEITERIVNEGHQIGNHTYSHQYSRIYSNPDAFMQDLWKAEEILYNVIQERPRIIRAPGGTQGNFTKLLVERLYANGYIFHDWNIDARDTSAPLVSAQRIQREVIQQAQNKDRIIVLFHDGPGKITLPEALPEIIEYLILEGFTFKVIDEDTEPVILMK
ncbi:polysaccharide deacetylase [Heliorestis acidaminivorans]|uniref:Polysaccharide deacetylase n=1 Tax=Heliorestis acidaminivorans TaxID=553427 RepID=A0A6I0EZQ9_9FIRM|nr:polysaccharide deacetylase family protein [Heliorestis acidaminivorans]KAB2954156.1 polysaccharide deacetylase [Heliorestis acidaminivorans]